MITLLTILTLIAPILAAALVYRVLVPVLLSRWDRRAETARFARRAAAEIDAGRPDAKRRRQAA